MNNIQWTVYLAAGYDQQERMRGYRKMLEERHIEVTSRWLDESGPAMRELEIAADQAAAVASGQDDLEDIARADFFVMFTDTPSTSGGRHTELGYAIASRKIIIIVGQRENVFQADMMHYPTFEELLPYLPE